MRVVFMGTPDFAVPTLEALIEKHEVVGVVTQPDKRKGRGKSDGHFHRRGGKEKGIRT
ncbi:MAG: hypothetical protein ACLRYY_07745 [Anaerobutyricum soehngenii]